MSRTLRTERQAHAAIRTTFETPRPTWQAPAPRRATPARPRYGAALAAAILGAVVLILAGCGGGDYCDNPDPVDVPACTETGRATIPAAPASAARI